MATRKTQTNILNDTLTNIVKMFVYRGWISPDNMNTYITDLLNDKNDDKVYTIKLKTPLLSINTYEQKTKDTDVISDEDDDNTVDTNVESDVSSDIDSDDDNISKNTSRSTKTNSKVVENVFDGTQIMIFLTREKITGKSNIINDIVKKNHWIHKLIIVDTITDKSRKNISLIPHTEIFAESEFQLNLADFCMFPQSLNILTNDETTEYTECYRATKKQTPKILEQDPMARFMYLKRGQILRIVRNSEFTGNSVFFRVCRP